MRENKVLSFETCQDEEDFIYELLKKIVDIEIRINNTIEEARKLKTGAFGKKICTKKNL